MGRYAVFFQPPAGEMTRVVPRVVAIKTGKPMRASDIYARAGPIRRMALLPPPPMWMYSMAGNRRGVEPTRALLDDPTPRQG